MADMAAIDDGECLGSDEVRMPAMNSWEFPLTRGEKMQRLLRLFETELDCRDDEIEALKEQNLVLSNALSAAQASAQSRKEDVIEASLQLKGLPGDCTIRGTPTQLGAIMQAIGAEQGFAKGEPRLPRLSSASSFQSSASSSPRSTPPSSPRMARARPTLPGLQLGSLRANTAATPRLSVGSRRSLGSKGAVGATPRETPRVFSIRTPPNRTPRVLAASSPQAIRGAATPRTPAMLGTPATPRAMSRVWSLVTPRASPAPESTFNLCQGALDTLTLGLVPLVEDDDRRLSQACSDNVDSVCSAESVQPVKDLEGHLHASLQNGEVLDAIAFPPGLEPVDTGACVWPPGSAPEDELVANDQCNDSPWEAPTEVETKRADSESGDQDRNEKAARAIAELRGLAFNAAGAVAAGARERIGLAISHAREGAARATAATEAVAAKGKNTRRQKCLRAAPRAAPPRL